jgi:hypothetical protein
MPAFYPYKIYTPTRVTDNMGGYSEVLGSGRVVWGALIVHKNITSLTIDAFEAAQIDDIIDTAVKEYYRVTEIHRKKEGGLKALILSRVDRPIDPN